MAPNGKSAYAAAVNPSATTPCCVVDQFTVQSNGALKAMSPASVTAAGSDDLVMTPDGRHLYVSNFGDPGLIDQYNVAANGRLSAINPPTVSTGLYPLGMAVTPDGHSLYVGLDSGGGLVEQFNIAAGGALSAKTPATVSLATNGAVPDSIAVSPNGKNLYVGDDYAGTGVEQFTIGSGGEVTAMTQPYVGTSDVSRVVVSPDAKSLYATEDLSGTVRYSVGAGGALTLTSDLAPTGQYAGGIAISPDQGPTAKFVDSPAAPGHATVFFGAASHDPDGKIARYTWTFGDGKSTATTSPTVHHVYARAGHYVVTLTVTDNDGASTQQVFTGHQVLLDGGPAARMKRTVVIVAPPKLTALKIEPDRFKVGSAGHGGATVTYRVTGSGRVALTIAQHTGAEPVPGKPGLDRFHFSGRWGGKALPAGHYHLKLVPSAGIVTGQARAATFTIVR